MERVRKARQQLKQLPTSKPVLKDDSRTVDVEKDEIELPEDKFMLLLSIIMELQRDIDYHIEAHEK